MSIFIRCPFCKSDQTLGNKVCSRCGKPIPKHNRTYRVIVKYKGEIATRVIPKSLELARTIEAKIKTELVSGEYYEKRKAKKESVKYSNFIKSKYLPYAKEKKSYIREEMMLRLWIIPTLGDKELSKISPFDIEKVKNIMFTNNKSPRTVQYALSIIRHSINKAIDWGIYTGVNPVTKVKAPKVNNKRTRFLSFDEAKELLQEIKRRSQQTYEICLMSLHTGMRAGEIFNLKFGDIDFASGLIHIKDAKNGEDRVAYLTEEIADILSSKQGKPDELIFKTKDGKRIKTISKAFNHAVEYLGLNNGITDRRDKVVFHTLRHTFASWLAIEGTPIYTIKELMGHKTISMTERYSHLSPNGKRDAVLVVADKLKDNVVVTDFVAKQ